MNDSNTPNTKEKAIFGLNWLANINAGIKDSYDNLLANAQKQIPAALQAANSEIGTWEVVWGPMIYCSDYEPRDPNKKIVTDNLMYVAKGKVDNTGDDMYVIALSGTNPVSVYGWFSEDFNVNEMVPWSADILNNYFKPGATQSSSSPGISVGTYYGLDVLINRMPQSTGLPSEEQDLVSWLKTNVGSQSTATELAVAGHSLAGTLTPVLGLWLIENRSLWNRGAQIPVSGYPTAGATPGNSNFATHTVSAYANQGGELAGFFNKYDMIPCGWEIGMLKNVPDLYKSSDMGGIQTCYAQKIAEAAINMAGNNDYSRFSTDQELSGSFIAWDKDVYKGLIAFLGLNSYYLSKLCFPYPDQVSNFAEFLLEVGAQHTTAYFQPGVMDMESFHDAVKGYFDNSLHFLMDEELFIDFINTIAKWLK